MLLRKIGFRPHEIHYGELFDDGRIVVPATVADESVLLLLDTGQRIDLSIYLGHATQHGWPYERRDELWGTSPLRSTFTLGRRRTHDRVVVRGRESDAQTTYINAGTLGVRYVNHAVLALDPVDAALGLSE